MPFLAVIALFAQSASAAPPNVDLVKAKKVFDTACASCHGPAGAGGKGPTLAVPKLRHAQTADQLAQIITGGIPGTEMPPSWYLGPEGIGLAMAYVGSLQANAVPPRVEGDVAKGKALFDGKGGCLHCHTNGSAGRAYGPDLSDVGAKRSAAVLREALITPRDAAEAYVPVTGTRRNGDKISGLRVNEDNFTIQIVDAAGFERSYRKSDLATLQEHPGDSPMPGFRNTFPAAELQDLVAYLSSLRGEP